MDLRINRKLLFKRINELSRIGKTPEGGVTRPSFSIQEDRARCRVRRWMTEAGLETKLDAALNLIGTWWGEERETPAIMTGSHLDSVPNGGKFDGVLGVLGGIEAIRAIIAAGVSNRRTVKVIAFSGEEPNIYGFSTFGSRAISGSLPKGVFERKDHRGKSLAELLEKRGGNPRGIGETRVYPLQVGAFVELHIEQGPVLHIRKIPIGVVSTLCGIQRFHVDIKGRSDHAGTTPINFRKDALAAGAEVILTIENISKSKGEKAIGTVGKITLAPNQVNVVPGRAQLEVDFRTDDYNLHERVENEIMEACGAVARKRGLDISVSRLSYESPIQLPEDLSRVVTEVCETMNLPFLRMTSWAGHDANHMAKITRTCVIFVPSLKGLSHCPQEWTGEEDIERGVRVLAGTLVRLANDGD